MGLVIVYRIQWFRVSGIWALVPTWLWVELRRLCWGDTLLAGIEIGVSSLRTGFWVRGVCACSGRFGDGREEGQGEGRRFSGS